MSYPVLRPAVRPAMVALGGGHGLSATLSALRHLSDRITAVVTVADDGGSSGRLRDELGILPPGDLRMALAALCDDSEWGRTWRDVLQHRFTSDGDLDQHAVGNLLIAALWDLLDDPVAGLDWVARLLKAQGRVLPMAAVPLVIEAEVEHPDGSTELRRGQVSVATCRGVIKQLRIVPEAPPALPQAIDAVMAADWVVLGPGSWYTSVLPHLLVPELAAALRTTPARRVVVLNLSPESGETEGMSCSQHLRVLHDMDPELTVHTVIADPRAVDDVDELDDVCASVSAQLLLRQVGRSDGTARHDALRLAAALRDVVDGVGSDLGQRS